MTAFSSQKLPLSENNSNDHQRKYVALNPVSPFTKRHMAEGLLQLLLLLAGIEPNPGPKTWRCSVCSQVLAKNTTSVKCNGCGDCTKAPCFAEASSPVPDSNQVLNRPLRFTPKNIETPEFALYEKEYDLKNFKIILHRIDLNPRPTASIPSNGACKEELIIKEEIASDVSSDVSNYDSFSNEPIVLDGKCLMQTESLGKDDGGKLTIGSSKAESPANNDENSRKRSHMESTCNESLLPAEDAVFMDGYSETPAYAKQNCCERGIIIKSDPSQDSATVAFNYEQRLIESNESLILPKQTEKKNSVKEKRHVCSVCENSYKTTSGLLRHLFIHTGERPYQCNICMKSFIYQGELDSHKESHSNERRHACMNCDKRFHRKGVLRRHERNIHSIEHYRGPVGQIFACAHCDKSFKFRSHISQHLMIHSDDRLFECSICRKHFKTKHKLKIHTLSHSDVRLHACTLCEKGFKTKSNLNSHMTVHENKKPFACGQCDERFKSKEYVVKHMKTHLVEKLFACCQCDWKFKTKISLSRHMLVHSAVRLHTCTRCGKVFKTTDDLKIHMTVHENKRLFACGQCDKRFKSKRYIRNHMKTHSVEKLFECCQCGQKFNTKYNLKQHILRCHSDVRSHACSQCAKRFNTRSQVIRHMTVHTDERPFSCEQCNKHYKSNQNLRKHMEVHSYE